MRSELHEIGRARDDAGRADDVAGPSVRVEANRIAWGAATKVSALRGAGFVPAVPEGAFDERAVGSVALALGTYANACAILPAETDFGQAAETAAKGIAVIGVGIARLLGATAPTVAAAFAAHAAHAASAGRAAGATLVATTGGLRFGGTSYRQKATKDHHEWNGESTHVPRVTPFVDLDQRAFMGDRARLEHSQ